MWDVVNLQENVQSSIKKNLKKIIIKKRKKDVMMHRDITSKLGDEKFKGCGCI